MIHTYNGGAPHEFSNSKGLYTPQLTSGETEHMIKKIFHSFLLTLWTLYFQRP